MNQQVTDCSEINGTGKELASWLKLSEMRVVQLAQEKIIKRDDSGKFLIKNCVAAYCEYIRGVSRGSDTAKEEQKERTRLTRVKAALAELEFEEKKGNLIDAEVARRQGHALAVILKNNLQSIADRVSSIIAAESDASVVHDLISTEVLNSLDNVVKNMEQTEVDDATLDITRRESVDILEKNDEKVSQETTD